MPCPWGQQRSTHSSRLFPPLPRSAVGEVVHGQEVVKKIESYGSDSGKTRVVIKIVDSGAA